MPTLVLEGVRPTIYFRTDARPPSVYSQDEVAILTKPVGDTLNALSGLMRQCTRRKRQGEMRRLTVHASISWTTWP